MTVEALIKTAPTAMGMTVIVPDAGRRRSSVITIASGALCSERVGR
jgi:hypothetical protein